MCIYIYTYIYIYICNWDPTGRLSSALTLAAPLTANASASSAARRTALVVVLASHLLAPFSPGLCLSVGRARRHFLVCVIWIELPGARLTPAIYIYIYIYICIHIHTYKQTCMCIERNRERGRERERGKERDRYSHRESNMGPPDSETGCFFTRLHRRSSCCFIPVMLVVTV